MKYRKGYKYQLAEVFEMKTLIHPFKDIFTQFITLRKNGYLKIHSGYAWDGASGPTIDTENTKTPSLVHDALYQLMRQNELGIQWRVPADKLLREMMIERGMWKVRAWWWYRGLQVADGDAALPENAKELFETP